MVIENSRCRRRRAVFLWTLLFVTSRVYQAEAIGLSRNPLFGGLYNYRRHAPPAATTHSLQHHRPFQFPQQPYQPEALPAASQVAQNSASPASTYNTGVDPYISGSNSIDNAQPEANDGGAASSSASTPSVTDSLVAQTAGNLATAASHTSYAASSGSGGYGGSSGGLAGGYGSGSGSVGGYSGGAASSSGGYGAASSGGSSGGYAPSGSGSGGANPYSAGAGSFGGSSFGGSGYGSGAGAGGSSYGIGAGAGGSSYGSGAGAGGSSYGHGGGFGGAGSIGSYGAGPSYSVSYAQQQTGPSKADTLNLLSSLAPSLLLSGLLLPLSLALLTNVSGLVTGRKKRDVLKMQDSEEEFDDELLQFPLDFDDLNARISAKDEHFFPVTSAMLEVYSPGDADRLSEFVREKGLLDKKNTCLHKMACMTSLAGKFKKSEKIHNAIKLLDKTNDKEITQRVKEGKTAASLGENECLTKFTCQRLKTA